MEFVSVLFGKWVGTVVEERCLKPQALSQIGSNLSK